MNNAVEFVKSQDYITCTYSVFENKSLYQIDYEIKRAKYPYNVIFKYRKMVLNAQYNLNGDISFAKAVADEIAHQLNGYSYRRNEMFKLFKNYMNNN